MSELRKYPRTPHLSGSRLQPGDDDLAQIQFESLRGKHLVVEEKVDGANSAISFEVDGRLRLQSRGHYLSGGPRERQFDLFKAWAHQHLPQLWEVLGSRYVMYGEWMYAKHTMYYNALPDYFLEFDVLDREEDVFLSTGRRQALLGKLGFIHSVPILYTGEVKDKQDLAKLMGPSRFIEGDHIGELRRRAVEGGYDPGQVVRETDASVMMEGMYIKVEEANEVKSRNKWVRASFHQAVADSGGHWMERRIFKNEKKT